MYHLQIFCLFDYTFLTVLKNKLILALKLAWGWTGPVGFRKKTAYLLIGSSLVFPSSARKVVVSSSPLSFKIPSSSPARGPPHGRQQESKGKLHILGLDHPCLFSLQQLALQLGCSSGLSMLVFYLCRKGEVSLLEYCSGSQLRSIFSFSASCWWPLSSFISGWDPSLQL